MDPALKNFLEAMEKSLKESIKDAKSASIERHEELVRKLEAHTARTEELAVAASSDATEFVLASAGMAEPPAPAPSIVASPLVAPAAPNDSIAMAPATCLTECRRRDANESTLASTLAASPTSPTATVDIIPVRAAAVAGDRTLEGEPVKGALSTAERSLAVIGVVCSDTTVVVHVFCSADCVTQFVTAPSPTPATLTTPLLLSPSARITDFRCHGLLLRPRPWPSFTSSCQMQSRLPPEATYPSLVQGKPRPSKKTTRVATLNLGAHAVLLLLSYGYHCVSYFCMTGHPGLTSHNITIFCCPEKSDNCSSLWALEKVKQVSDSVAGHVQHMMLKLERAEMHQFSAQHGKDCSWFLQPKPPWLSILTQVDIDVAQGGAHPHANVMTQNSEITLHVLLQDWLISWTIGNNTQCGFQFLQWQIVLSFQWGGSEIASTKFKASLLPNVGKEIIQANYMVVFYWGGVPTAWSVFATRLRPPQSYPLLDDMKHNKSMRSSRTLILAFLEVSGVIGFDLWSQFGTMIMLIWSSQFMAFFNGSEQSTNFNELSLALLSLWQHVKYTQWSWEPGGCTFALCSHEKKWITLHCYEQFQWSSVQLAYIFRIWLVAWIAHGLEFSTCRGQPPFQGGRNTLRDVFLDQVHVSRTYYLASTNQILVGCNCYLNEAYSFDMVCSIIYYREKYHGDFSKTKEVHRPWDPGKVSPLISSEASAWGQAEFQGGRDVRTLTYRYIHMG